MAFVLPDDAVHPGQIRAWHGLELSAAFPDAGRSEGTLADLQAVRQPCGQPDRYDREGTELAAHD